MAYFANENDCRFRMLPFPLLPSPTGLVFCLLWSTPFAFATEPAEPAEFPREQPVAEYTSPILEAVAPSAVSTEQRKQTAEEELEERIQKLEAGAHAESKHHAPALGPSVFNPSMEIVLSEKYGFFSKDATNIPGFQTGNEGRRAGKGFSLDESSIRLMANVDHKLYGALTLSVAERNGKDEVGLEEAFLKTFGLPLGLSIKAGRMLPIFGSMNEMHKHADSFIDRPLPYRAYLNDAFSEDGIQASMVLPTDLYAEVGGGIFRGRGFPASAAGNTPGLFIAYARVGGDIGISHVWRLGAYYLHAKNSQGREADGLVFGGKNDLYSVDVKYTYAPQGNDKRTGLALQAEYLFRNEKGHYDNGFTSAFANTKTSGFYAQAIYKFMHSYRLGARYAFLNAPRKPPAGFESTSLDSGNRNPWMLTFLAEYNISEFSRFRFQYNHSTTHNKADHQVVLQYTLTLGAHAAHEF